MTLLKLLDPNDLEDLVERLENSVTVRRNGPGKLTLQTSDRVQPALRIDWDPQQGIHWNDHAQIFDDNPELPDPEAKPPEALTQYCRQAQERELAECLAGTYRFKGRNPSEKDRAEMLQELRKKGDLTKPKDLAAAVWQELAAAVDPATRAAAQQMLKHPRIASYNTVHQAREFLDGLLQTNPGAVCWTLGADRHIESIQHPGQLVARAKNSMLQHGLESRNWKQAARIAPELMRAMTDAGARPAAAHCINAIILSPAPPPPDLAGLVVESYLARSQNSKEKPNWKNLEIFAQLIFKEYHERAPEQTDINARLYTESQEVYDYVNELGRQDQQLRSKSWKALRERAEIWHREQATTPTRHKWAAIVKQQNGQYRCWNTLIEEQEIQGYRVIPLTDQYMLYEESMTLGHCVIDYGTNCAGGSSRIFAIRPQREFGPPATGELTWHHSDGWRNNQLRGPKNHPVNENVAEIMNELVRQYNEQWQTRSQDHLSWSEPLPEEKKPREPNKA